MGQPLSLDLRRRVVAAVAAGSSRRQAAERFGVSAASAVRWCQRDRQGSLAPHRQGGDRRTGRIEAEAPVILALVAATPDITLTELQARLHRERGLHFGIGTLWRFFDRRRITYKKSPRTPPSRTGPTS